MTDRGYLIIELSLPNKPRRVPGVDHRRFLNGTSARLRPASSRPDGPPRHGSSTTCCNRFVRWRQAGVHNRFWLLFPRLSKADCVAGLAWGRVLQQSATGKKGARRPRHGTRRAPIASSADRLRIGSVVYATCSSAVRAHQAFPELATGHEMCPETTSPPAYALRIWYATRCGPHRPHGSLQTIFWQIRKECRCIHAFPSRPARRFHEWRRRRSSAEG